MRETQLVNNEFPYERDNKLNPEKIEETVDFIDQLNLALSLGFTASDFQQIHKMGISVYNIQNQLSFFKTGISKINLDRPAQKHDGILFFEEEKHHEFARYFDSGKNQFKIKKFVPASGAASRMFKFLSEFLNEFEIENESVNAYINRKSDTKLQIFLAGSEKFPFFQNVLNQLQTDFSDFNTWSKDRKIFYFITYLLDKKYFDFSSKPKAVLPFHQYETHLATPIHEHINEAINYAVANNVTHIHFTVSEEHLNDFKRIIDEVKPQTESQSGIEINIAYSYQDSATDTIAVMETNEPLRNSKGELVFRPGGHGALIKNLNELDADIIFIKNIDNVVQNHIDVTTLYKKSLAGILLQLQTKIFGFLEKIENKQITSDCLDSIAEFLQTELHFDIQESIASKSFEEKSTYIFTLLNRPIRVGGMVKNEGEPGGGPFWVKNSQGQFSLQIVESSQVDFTDDRQKEIFARSTHFNPVDLVCATKNFRGEKFDLSQFVDENTGFIVKKSKNGVQYKSYELPGLWNGAMANWITIFVEVPLITFNPVKTVNDLLKPTHRP